MRSVFVLFSIVFLILLSPVALRGQECPVDNRAFTFGEEVSYHIVYKWGIIWLEAGAVTFSVDTATIFGRKVFHYTGKGGSYPKYDWIYKVRDTYEAWSDTNSLKPLRFRREVDEGGRYFIEDDFFVQAQVYHLRTDPKKALFRDTIPIKPCTFDPLSAVYYARSLDFDKHKEGDKIYLNMFIDREHTPVYVRYMGREVFEMPDGQKYNTIKFKPLLIEGTIFKGGEHMTVWVTDDKNRIPLYIESDILIGSVKAIMTDAKHLRHAYGAKINGK